MIKLFRFFIVLFIAANTEFAWGDGAVSAAMQAARAEKEAVKVIIKDDKGKPISGLDVVTVNLINKQFRAKTDASGVARFENVCSAFGNLGRAYSNARRNNPNTTKRPVRIKVSDPANKYKSFYGYLEWDDYTNKTGCERVITVKPDMIRETFPTAEQLKYAFDKRTGKLKFYNICTHDVKPGGNIKYGCVDAFKNVDTQLTEGIFLAQEYMLKNIIPTGSNTWIECVGTPIRTKGNQDFLKCTSTDGKYAYDFEFDDLIESTDKTVQTDAAQALCETIHGGKFESGAGRYFCTKGDAADTKDMCNKMRGTSYGLSWTTQFYPSIQVGTTYSGSAMGANVRASAQTRQNVCVFDFRSVGKDYKPKTIPGVDNYKYEYIEVRSLPSLEFLLHQYVQAQTGTSFNNFNCTSGFRQWKSPNGTKHIFECTVINDDATKSDTIEFVFDNINVRSELYSNAGESGMGCIGAGGSFDGAQCHGMTQSQCTELGKIAPGGTKWDNDIKQCTLNEAQKLQTLRTVGDTIVTGLTVAGSVVVVVATAGTAAPAIAALAVVGGTLSVGGTIVDKTTSAQMQSKAEEFKELYDNCKNQPVADQDPCARSALQAFLGYIETYIDSDVFDGQYAKSLDEIFRGFIELTEPESITQKDIKYYSLQKMLAKSTVVKQRIASAATIIGDFAMIFAGGAVAIAKLGKVGVTVGTDGVAVVNAASRGNKMSRFFARVYNLSKKSGSVANDARVVQADVQSATNKLEYIPSAQGAACWVGGHLQACS